MKGKKFISLLICLIVFSFVFSGCGNKDSRKTSDSRTIVDATGIEIEVPTHPEHIVVSPVVLPNMIYFMTSKDNNQIAITPSALEGYENSIMKDLAPNFKKYVNKNMVNNDMQVSLEELANSNADLVIFWDTQSEEAKKVNKMGIPAVCVKSATDMNSLRQLIKMLGEILNCKDRADELLQWYDEVDTKLNKKDSEIRNLSDSEKPKVVQFRDINELSVYAKGVDAKLIEKVGGTNIELTASSADSSKVTMEEVLNFNPDIILLSNWDDSKPDDLYKNIIPGQDWSDVAAVKNHRVYKVPMGLYRWTPPNCTEKPLYAMYLSSVIQPDIYKVDMDKEIKNFFSKFFDHNLSKEQLDRVVHREINGNSKI